MEYCFGIRAVNAVGFGTPATVCATPNAVPAAPANLEAAPGDTRVTLSWDDPGDATIVKYQWKQDDGG